MCGFHEIVKMKNYPEFQQCIENDIQMHIRRNRPKYKEDIAMFMKLESCCINTEDAFNGNKNAQNINVIEEIIRTGALNVESLKTKKKIG